MISITADSYWHLMAKQQYLQFTWGQVGVVISGTAGALWLVLSVVTQDIRDRLLSIDTSISQFNITLKSHGESIAGINERMKGLDRRVELGSVNTI